MAVFVPHILPQNIYSTFLCLCWTEGLFYFGKRYEIKTEFSGDGAQIDVKYLCLGTSNPTCIPFMATEVKFHLLEQ